MDWSKVAELMRIYLAEHRGEMTPDDITAHIQVIDALLETKGSFRQVKVAYHNLLMGARRAKNMLIRGGDFIGCKTNNPQQLSKYLPKKEGRN
jgi:hypothetical protein